MCITKLICSTLHILAIYSLSSFHKSIFSTLPFCGKIAQHSFDLVVYLTRSDPKIFYLFYVVGILK